MRQRGVIDRTTQIRLVADTVWASVKERAAVSAVLGVLLLVFLWMAFPLSILGVFGAGKATTDLVDTFWDGLTEEKQSEVRSFAYEAGVNLSQLFQRRAA